MVENQGFLNKNAMFFAKLEEIICFLWYVKYINLEILQRKGFIMTKNDRIFVDGMAAVKMVEGVIQMSFFNNINNQREKCGEICMSQQAFLNAFGAMENLINQLVEAGIVQRNGNTPAEPPKAAADSPNFE